MNYQIVSRVVLGVSTLFVTVALIFAYLMTHTATQAKAATPAESGAALFARHCGGCHAVAEIAPAVRANPKAQREFLKQHGAAGDAEDQLIIDYLLTLK